MNAPIPRPRPSVPRTDSDPVPNGNGHGPASPRASLSDLPGRELGEDMAIGVELIRERVDALQVDVRDLRRESREAAFWRAQATEQLRHVATTTTHLTSTVDRIEAAVLQLIAVGAARDAKIDALAKAEERLDERVENTGRLMLDATTRTEAARVALESHTDLTHEARADVRAERSEKAETRRHVLLWALGIVGSLVLLTAAALLGAHFGHPVSLPSGGH